MQNTGLSSGKGNQYPPEGLLQKNFLCYTKLNRDGGGCIMETLEQVLRRHARKYPQMQPTDAVKLIYQNVFGGGHLIRDPEVCRRALEQEYAATPQERFAPLVESIGNGMVRVMLNALENSGYSVQQLGDDFIRCAEQNRENRKGFLLKLDVLRKVTAAGVFGFTLEELDTYLCEYKKAGYPVVSHSRQYRQAYKPAYRVVSETVLPDTVLLKR